MGIMSHLYLPNLALFGASLDSANPFPNPDLSNDGSIELPEVAQLPEEADLELGQSRSLLQLNSTTSQVGKSIDPDSRTRFSSVAVRFSVKRFGGEYIGIFAASRQGDRWCPTVDTLKYDRSATLTSLAWSLP